MVTIRYEVMSYDTEKATFFMKSLGYALTGDNHYETMFILFGAPTRNGKRTNDENFSEDMWWLRKNKSS